MNPKISRLSSLCFYNNSINDGENVKSEEWIGPWCKSNIKFGPLEFFNVTGEMNRGDFSQNQSSSSCNELEADQVLNCVVELCRRFPDIVFSERIAIISPYSAQVSLIKIKLRKYFEEEKNQFMKKIQSENDKTFQFYDKKINLENTFYKEEFMKADIIDFISVNSVDGYQGQENDIVILSTVRSKTNRIGFLRDQRRLNVAITRARKSLIIFGNAETLSMNNNWKKVITCIKSMGCFTNDANHYFKMYHGFPINIMPTDYFDELTNEIGKFEKVLDKLEAKIEVLEYIKIVNIKINQMKKLQMKKNLNITKCYDSDSSESEDDDTPFWKNICSVI